MTLQVRYSRVGSGHGPLLVIHGGAGARTPELSSQMLARYRSGLSEALRAGSEVLRADGSALDAACAAVVQLEDNPLFNAAHGAALTSAGTAELDAAVMTGDGRAGAVAACTQIRNPILAARAVMEHTDHVLLVDPDPQLIERWQLERVPREYFVTERRQRQLAHVLAQREAGGPHAAAPHHGTVGAVALDVRGAVACATSTGGIVGQAVGRVGDTPLIGAGSFADTGSAALSCTGDGEAYIRGVVAHDIAARIRYAGATLADAAAATYAREMEARGATGGTIALTPNGDALILHNSPVMFAGFWEPATQQTFV